MIAKQRRRRRREHERAWGMSKSSCRWCHGTGMRSGPMWAPAMSFTDSRTGRTINSPAGWGFASRVCVACGGSGERVVGGAP